MLICHLMNSSRPRRSGQTVEVAEGAAAVAEGAVVAEELAAVASKRSVVPHKTVVASAVVVAKEESSIIVARIRGEVSNLEVLEMLPETLGASHK